MNQFRRARLIQGMTQAEVASELGVSIVAVNKWENGRTMPKAKRLKQIAEVLSTTVEKLLENERTV